MSDDGYGYDDEYDYFSEEDIAEDLADHVDSLAEHALHSPILVNAHPDFQIDYDELAYMTDEYYDGDGDIVETNGNKKEEGDAKLGKRKRDSKEHGKQRQQSKKRKTTNLGDSPPLIIWRKKSNEHEKEPTVQPNDGMAVSLLPNWRELLDTRPEKGSVLAVNIDNITSANGQLPGALEAHTSPKKNGISRKGKRPRNDKSLSPVTVGAKLENRVKKIKGI